MNRFVALSLFVWLCAPLAGGCQWLSAGPPKSPATSPLAPIDLSSDGADLELVFVRFPLGDPELCEKLWHDIDEQSVPAAVRRELATNGLRCGLIGGTLPPVLAQRIAAVEDQSTPESAAAKYQNEPPVRRWRLQAHRGRPGKIITSQVYDQLSLLTNDDGQVRGQTYPHAQGLLSIAVDPQADGRVNLSLTPELEYGDSRQTWTGQDGVFRLQSGKPLKTFDKLRLDVALASDQILVLTSLPQRSGSLGHYLFTEPRAGHIDQKLLLVRLAKTKFDDLFAAATQPEAPPSKAEAPPPQPPAQK